MTAQMAAYGRVVSEVQSKTTGNGGTMAFTRLAVALPCRAAENGETTMWLGVTAFGRQADALVRHQKGDLVSVSGQLQVNQWTGQGGEIQSGYALVADSVVSVRTARPGGKKGQQGQATDALKRAQEQQSRNEYDQTPPDDDIPF
ncbi:single-stranded DNA-binding protein [Citrobacter sp. NCU1]|uniref:single-stranded DNA-binding protein n=1 Tax=Citrobacter sp. NCU1 TaxID=2026683 RepID=UPI0013913B35|nr:single-stranded DNA-binding protein [Citrobacter sp. NCU1]NDO80211.1 single-stranded DNA-binding protein [Citrobacter sp. NCU1]